MADVHREGELDQLGVSTCNRLLAEHYVGRVALNDPDGPLVVPVNYAMESGTVVFRTAPGSKLDAAEDGTPASFQIDHVDLDRRLGWSVLVRGHLVEVTDEGALARLRDVQLEPFAGEGKDHYVRVITERMTGRRIPLPTTIPPEWRRIHDTHTWFGRDGDDLLG